MNLLSNILINKLKDQLYETVDSDCHDPMWTQVLEGVEHKVIVLVNPVQKTIEDQL